MMMSRTAGALPPGWKGSFKPAKSWCRGQAFGVLPVLAAVGVDHADGVLPADVFYYAAISPLPQLLALHDDALALETANMRIWLRLLLQEPTVARFVSEVCATKSNFARQREKRYDFCCALYGQPETPQEADRMQLRATLMAGMLVEMCRSIPMQTIEGDPEDYLDDFFRDYYLHIPDEEHLECAIARDREAARGVRLRVDDNFHVSLA